jgi:hypothetical protein
MWIRTRPASASISLEARTPTTDRPERAREIVSFELLPTNERDHLDLDTGEVFQDYGYARTQKNEGKLIGASITMRSTNDKSDGEQSAMHYMREVTGDFHAHPSTIMFDVFIEPTVFTKLLENTRIGLIPETITIDLVDMRSSFFTSSEEQKKEAPFAYGWEPDGSRQIWHNKERENQIIPIESVRFKYAIVKPRYDEQFHRLLPMQSDAPTERITDQITPIRAILVEMSKHLRWAMIGIVALAIMVGIFIAKQSR